MNIGRNIFANSPSSFIWICNSVKNVHFKNFFHRFMRMSHLITTFLILTHKLIFIYGHTHVQFWTTKEFGFRKYTNAILLEGRYRHKKTQILPHYQLYAIYILPTTKRQTFVYMNNLGQKRNAVDPIVELSKKLLDTTTLFSDARLLRDGFKALAKMVSLVTTNLYHLNLFFTFWNVCFIILKIIYVIFEIK